MRSVPPATAAALAAEPARSKPLVARAALATADRERGPQAKFDCGAARLAPDGCRLHHPARVPQQPQPCGARRLRRPLRRRLPSLGGRPLKSRLLLLLVVVGAGCAACGSAKTTTAAGGVVPWLDKPLPLYLIPNATLIRYPTSAPPCRARQLRVSQGRNAVGLNHHLEELVFSNVGAKACLLRGYPTISAHTPAGVRRTLHPRRGGTFVGQLLAADIRAGGRGLL